MPSRIFPYAALGVGFGLLLAGTVLAKAVPAPADPAALDQRRIHAEYNEGNFERVIASLEAFMARNGTYSQDDSIFIAKHLAVVYSANPETREKGKYYMHRLLALLPSAKLVDMYVSDEIERIFDKVREEFMARQKAFGVDSSRISVPGDPPSTPRMGRSDPAGADRKPGNAAPEASQGKRNLKPFYLAAGGAALVAAGVTTYIMLGSSPKRTERIYDVE